VTPDLTELLNRARAGDHAAADLAFAGLYSSLHQIAQRLAAGDNATLSATALVHEAFLKLMPAGQIAPLADREHFLRLAARAMRQVLVDAARERNAQKRGGGWTPVEVSESLGIAASSIDLLALDQALDRLEARDPNLARIVEAYFFAGLSFGAIAESMHSSERSVRRGWALAQAFLLQQLGEAAVPDRQ
jgi:RNA polymerase sigma factor (TIGR02999 family)